MRTEPKTSIRQFQDSDLKTVVSIVKATLLDHVRDSGGDPSLVSEDFLRSTLSESQMLVVEGDGDVVGYLQYQVKPPDLMINGAALFPQWQRRGLGCRLFTAAVRQAASEGCTRVVISVQPTNVSIRDLYVRLGFIDGSNPSGWNQEMSMTMEDVLALLRSRGPERSG